MTTIPEEIKVGVAGWSYPDWKGIVYPRHPPRGFDPLDYLIEFVDVIEINTTFYRIPTNRTVLSWVSRARAKDTKFEFTVKAPSTLTHGERSRASRDGALTRPKSAEPIDTSLLRSQASSFVECLKPIHEARMLGAWLLQFPFWFQDERSSRTRLECLVPEFQAFGDTVVELRHDSWFQPSARRFLKDLGVQVASLDMPGSGSEGEQIRLGFAGAPYVRWHGRNRKAWFREGATRDGKYDHLYDAKVVTRWIEHVRRATHAGRVAYVIANNHFRGQALANALQARSILRGHSVPAPPSLLDTYPELEPWVVPKEDKGQRGLFEDLDQS